MMDPTEFVEGAGTSLLSRISNGDHVAFASLFSHHRNKVYTTALRLTGSYTEAEEIVQDVFVKIWVGRQKLTEVQDIESYLFIIARNLIYDAMKRTARRKAKLKVDIPARDFSLPEAENILQEKQLEQVVRDAIDQLPAQQKAVYLLARNEGLTKSEIAERLQLSPHTVKSHYDRAVRSLRAHCVSVLKILLVIGFIR